ncbi:YraN family protein [Vibrio gallicus]|uniref:YraN family protein n=1 Tax=Vibrio gallicus TaxID=190897 RepID=UPI0021C2BA97|nr:YraN family protein [Vibrio gallicus]
MSLLSKFKIGQQYETQALQFLQGQGLTLVERNFRAKCGEIDLIMLENDEIIFVEVKYRSHTNFGVASESVTRAKQSKLIKTAQIWLSTNKKSAHHTYFRFDVVTITGQQQQIEWIKNALTEG